MQYMNDKKPQKTSNITGELNGKKTSQLYSLKLKYTKQLIGCLNNRTIYFVMDYVKAVITDEGKFNFGLYIF